MLKKENLEQTHKYSKTVVMVWYDFHDGEKSVRVYVGAKDYSRLSSRCIRIAITKHKMELEAKGYTNTTLSPINRSKTTYFQAKDHNGKKVCGLMTKFKR
jgi:hypothetical protein